MYKLWQLFFKTRNVYLAGLMQICEAKEEIPTNVTNIVPN